MSDAWLAGAVVQARCIRTPDDIKGQKIRAAGPTFAAMWQAAGASIVSIPSNEVYNALADRRRRGTDTSTGSFAVVPALSRPKCLTAPEQQRVVVHVRAGADVEEELRSRWTEGTQQDALLQGERKAQKYYEDRPSRSTGDDQAYKDRR